MPYVSNIYVILSEWIMQNIHEWVTSNRSENLDLHMFCAINNI